MFRVYGSIFLAVFFWGSAFPGIALALRNYSPESVSFGRAFVATIITFILYRFSKCPKKFPLKDRLKAFSFGVIGIGIYSLTLSIGEKTMPAAVSGFIVGQMPLIAAILAAVFLKEKPSLKIKIGIAVSIVGLFLIAIGESGTASFGPAFLLVCNSAVCGGIYTCIQKPLLKRMPTLPFIFHALFGAACFLFLIICLFKVDFIGEFKASSFQGTLPILYLGAFPSVVAYLGWTYAIGRIDIAKAGVLLYGMPIVGGLLSWFFLYERPNSIALVGMFFAFLGSLIGSIKIKRKRAFQRQTTIVPKAALKIK
ncbi:MAG: hypothetical protein S4CHLAM7_14800 [Chlamydiae bacterium]|nr:hypothetical protein [Chlamydiota bacterium]